MSNVESIVDQDIKIGNNENLTEFKKHFNHHDQITLDGYYNISKKKSSMLIVRRIRSNDPQMQILVVPYKFAESKGGIRNAIKSRVFPHMGWIRAIPVDSKHLFVFGELITKHDGLAFSSPVQVGVKRKPFAPRIKIEAQTQI